MPYLFFGGGGSDGGYGSLASGCGFFCVSLSMCFVCVCVFASRPFLAHQHAHAPPPTNRHQHKPKKNKTQHQSWIDAGKFLTGFSAVGSVAVPAILAHAKVITPGAMLMELAAVAVLGATVVTYDYFATRDSMSYF
jgi:hypothetical protein